MNSFINRIRSGAGKAAFEADKLRRITAIQSTMKTLELEVEQETFRLGDFTFSLYSENRLSEHALKQACEGLAGLKQRLVECEREIQAVREEEYVEPSPYGRVCPRGHGSIPPESNRCQTCGAKAVAAVASTRRSDLRCATCDTLLPEEASFCVNCGAPAPEVSATGSELALVECGSCGFEMSQGAAFCSNCGAPLRSDGDTLTNSSGVNSS